MGAMRWAAGAFAAVLAGTSAWADDAMDLSADAQEALDAALAGDIRAEDRARDDWRNPGETLAFFGVTPGMTVVEANPGRGWYSRVLLPYVGADGALWGTNYHPDMFPERADDEEFLARMAGFPDTYVEGVGEWAPEGLAAAGGFVYGETPDALAGQVDAILYIRALHGVARRGGLETVVSDAFTLVKPGGVIGVVQHRAKADADAQWANGQHGYMREADVIAAFEGAGFVFEESAEINANPNDPTDDLGPWRLPPVSNQSESEKAEEYLAIGESDRMTLRFRKPDA